MNRTLLVGFRHTRGAVWGNARRIPGSARWLQERGLRIANAAKAQRCERAVCPRPLAKRENLLGLPGPDS